MQKLLNFVPLLVVVAVFAPNLLIGRYAGNQPITASDLVFMLPVLAYFWPLLVVNKFAEDSYTYLSKDDRRNYSVLVIGLNGLLFIMWLLAFLSGGIPLAAALSTAAAFGFSVYDLLRLINGLQKTSELNRVVWLHVFLPFFVAGAIWTLPAIYTHWQLVPNPIAVFFIMRAILSAVDRPLTS